MTPLRDLTMMTSLLAGLMLGLAPGVLAQAPQKIGNDGYATDSLDAIKKQVAERKAVLVDVREKNEWDQGHLNGAVFLPLSQLTAWERDGLAPADKAALEKALPKGAVVFTHCAAGGRSVPGGEILRKLGHDARPLRQGYQALLQAGFAKAPDK